MKSDAQVKEIEAIKLLIANLEQLQSSIESRVELASGKSGLGLEMNAGAESTNRQSALRCAARWAKICERNQIVACPNDPCAIATDGVCEPCGDKREELFAIERDDNTQETRCALCRALKGEPHAATCEVEAMMNRGIL